MAEIRRDQYNRPIVRLPDNDGEKAYTRVTTLAKQAEDEGGLTTWKQRLTAIGLVQRPDLYALVSTTDYEDKKALNRIVAQAFEHAGASSRANLGTALHALTEQLDLGMPVDPIPALKADLEAYQAAMKAHGFRCHPAWVERFLVIDSLEAAGTADRFVKCPDGKVRVFDIKTGTDLSYSWRSIAVQLGLYANGQAYDPETGARSPLPDDLDLEWGIVCHLPAGEARCDMYFVNIDKGFKIGAELSWMVHQWRKRRNLHRLIEPGALVHSSHGQEAPASAAEAVPAEASNDDYSASQGGSLPAPTRPEWMHSRIEAIRAAGHVQELQLRWPAEVVGPKRWAEWTDIDIEQLVGICDYVEKLHGLPFFANDPAQPKITHADLTKPVETPKKATKAKRERTPEDDIRMTKADIAALVKRLEKLPDDRKLWVRGLAKQCDEAGTSLSLVEPTKYRFCAMRALLFWSEHMDEELICAAGRLITGTYRGDAWDTIVHLAPIELVELGFIAQHLDDYEASYDEVGPMLTRVASLEVEQVVAALGAELVEV